MGAPGCVPYNIWTLGAVTPEQWVHLGTSFKPGQRMKRYLAALSTATLLKYGVKTPWAATGLGIAVGGEYRRKNAIET